MPKKRIRSYSMKADVKAGMIFIIDPTYLAEIADAEGVNSGWYKVLTTALSMGAPLAQIATDDTNKRGVIVKAEDDTTYGVYVDFKPDGKTVRRVVIDFEDTEPIPDAEADRFLFDQAVQEIESKLGGYG